MWWAKSAPLVVTGLTELQNSWWAKAAALRSNPGIQLLNCGLFIFWLWTWTYIQVQIWYSIHISISISVLTEKKNSKPWVLQQKSCRKPNTNNQPLLSNNLKLTLKYASGLKPRFLIPSIQPDPIFHFPGFYSYNSKKAIFWFTLHSLWQG